MIERERHARAYFAAVRSLRAEQAQCARVLALLIPPSILGVRSRASSEEIPTAIAAPLPAWSGGGGGGNGGIGGGGGGSKGGGGGKRSVHGGLLSVPRDERFAERFPSASVMFVEGAHPRFLFTALVCARIAH